MLDAHFTFSREWKAFPLAGFVDFHGRYLPPLAPATSVGLGDIYALCHAFCAPNYDKSRLIYPRSGPHSPHMAVDYAQNEPKYRTIQQKTRVKGQVKVWGMHKGGCLPGPVRGLGFPRTKYHPWNRSPRVPYYVAKRNTANT